MGGISTGTVYVRQVGDGNVTHPDYKGGQKAFTGWCPNRRGVFESSYFKCHRPVSELNRMPALRIVRPCANYHPITEPVNKSDSGLLAMKRHCFQQKF